MEHLVVLTGAGMSEESGLKTFRDQGGLWENYDVMEVASYEGWAKNKTLVLQFYNERRRQLKNAKPNSGHTRLAELEKFFKVDIITQNVDNLHEMAGSKNVLHLHGELTKVRSTKDPGYVKDIGYSDVHVGDLCPKGGQLRPDVVWFGEAVPAMDEAIEITTRADIFVVIGTSLNVYPAAGLINYAPAKAKIFLIDPKPINAQVYREFEFICEKAGKGVEILSNKLLNKG